MNPHHFLLTEASALAQEGTSAQRPMDEMEVRPGFPAGGRIRASVAGRTVALRSASDSEDPAGGV